MSWNLLEISFDDIINPLENQVAHCISTRKSQPCTADKRLELAILSLCSIAIAKPCNIDILRRGGIKLLIPRFTTLPGYSGVFENPTRVRHLVLPCGWWTHINFQLVSEQ
ncbi:hypothetical protein HAX54_010481, partial [Datura stramonium]|nr:hypothetical protein [Datura stramonium]